MKQYKRFATLLLSSIFLISCSDKNYILAKQNFSSGKWLLVDRNWLTDSVRCISDVKVLDKYSEGLVVVFDDNDKGTTCDGIIELYKDGRLVNFQEYLSVERINQPPQLDKLYHPCWQRYINTYSTEMYTAILDSLKKRDDTYPIEQTDDRGSVIYYKLDSSSNIH